MYMKHVLLTVVFLGIACVAMLGIEDETGVVYGIGEQSPFN